MPDNSEALGCLFQYGVFFVAFALPLIASAEGGPIAGAAGAVVSLVVYHLWGVRPIPGLIPGLLYLDILGVNLAVLGWAAWRLLAG